MGTAIGKLVAALAVTAILAMIGVTPAFAADQVGFKAQASGSFIQSGSHLDLVSAGKASHLGRTTNSGDIDIDLLTPPTCTGGFKLHDVETLTSIQDDDDRITISIDSEACPTATPGVYKIVGPYTVTGGAGRFAGASGVGTAVCSGDFINNTFKFTLTGTISRPSGG